MLKKWQLNTLNFLSGLRFFNYIFIIDAVKIRLIRFLKQLRHLCSYNMIIYLLNYYVNKLQNIILIVGNRAIRGLKERKKKKKLNSHPLIINSSLYNV